MESVSTIAVTLVQISAMVDIITIRGMFVTNAHTHSQERTTKEKKREEGWRAKLRQVLYTKPKSQNLPMLQALLQKKSYAAHSNVYKSRRCRACTILAAGLNATCVSNLFLVTHAAWVISEILIIKCMRVLRSFLLGHVTFVVWLASAHLRVIV